MYLQKADKQYQLGVIRSKYEFSCPGFKCKAPAICANLDKAAELRKRDPYYKVDHDQHTPGCAILRDLERVDLLSLIFTRNLNITHILSVGEGLVPSRAEPEIKTWLRMDTRSIPYEGLN